MYVLLTQLRVIMKTSVLIFTQYNYANLEDCSFTYTLSSKNIREYVARLEQIGIGPSGLLMKLRRIQMAVEWTVMEAEDGPACVQFTSVVKCYL